MEKIIVPIDFSPYSDNSLQAAILIAYKTGAAISLIHVVPTDLNWSALPEDEKQAHKQIIAQGLTAIEKLESMINASLLDGVMVEKKILHGYPYEQISNFARQIAADLIVMEAYGKEYKNKSYIGSTLQKTLRTAPCPVLTIKNTPTNQVFKKLVFASNFDVYTKEAFYKLAKLAKLFEATLHLVLVNTPEKFMTTPKARALINSFLTGMEGVPIQTHIYDYTSIDGGLESFVNSMGDCWLALATRERKLSGLYQIGITETLIYRL